MLQNRFYKNQLFKNSFILIWRKFLDRVFQKQGLRSGRIQGQTCPGYCKNNLHPPRRIVLFLQKLCFCQILFQGQVATIRTNKTYAKICFHDFTHFRLTKVALQQKQNKMFIFNMLMISEFWQVWWVMLQHWSYSPNHSPEICYSMYVLITL